VAHSFFISGAFADEEDPNNDPAEVKALGGMFDDD
jgi:hypothetical protein